MTSISREQLKNEIDTLDSAYLELVYKLIRQFPHLSPVSQTQETMPHQVPFSQRWRGKLGNAQFSTEDLNADPRLAYLSQRYKL